MVKISLISKMSSTSYAMSNVWNTADKIGESWDL